MLSLRAAWKRAGGHGFTSISPSTECEAWWVMSDEKQCTTFDFCQEGRISILSVYDCTAEDGDIVIEHTYDIKSVSKRGLILDILICLSLLRG